MSDAGGAAAAAAAAQSSRPAAGTEVYTWGRGDCGQLGSDAAQDSAAPTAIDSLHGRDIVNAAVGALHAAVVTGAKLGWHVLLALGPAGTSRTC